MSKYVVLLTGRGGGCDYSIDCNKSFEVFEAEGDEDAEKHCRWLWKCFGGSDTVHSIELFCIDRSLTIPVSQWNERVKAKMKNLEICEEIRKAEAHLQELRTKQKETTP